MLRNEIEKSEERLNALDSMRHHVDAVLVVTHDLAVDPESNLIETKYRRCVVSVRCNSLTHLH